MTLKRILNKINRPGEFFRYGSIRKRNFYTTISKFLRPWAIKRRIAVRDKRYASAKKGNIIDESKGYLITDAWCEEALMRDVLTTANMELAAHLASNNRQHVKSYLQTVDQLEPLGLQHPYFKLATSEGLLDIASRYLGFVPILSDIQLWYSPNDGQNLAGSQFFHLDYADVRQVKAFVLISDIDQDSGPTVVVDAASSQRICNSIGYKLSNKDIRVSDEAVFSFINPSELVEATGKAGSIFFADTSRCLHYGSRHGNKPRVVLLIQYVSPFSFRYSLRYRNDAKFSHLISDANSEELNLILGND